MPRLRAEEKAEAGRKPSPNRGVLRREHPEMPNGDLVSQDRDSMQPCTYHLPSM